MGADWAPRAPRAPSTSTTFRCLYYAERHRESRIPILAFIGWRKQSLDDTIWHCSPAARSADKDDTRNFGCRTLFLRTIICSAINRSCPCPCPSPSVILASPTWSKSTRKHALTSVSRTSPRVTVTRLGSNCAQPAARSGNFTHGEPSMPSILGGTSKRGMIMVLAVTIKLASYMIDPRFHPYRLRHPPTSTLGCRFQTISLHHPSHPAFPSSSCRRPT